MVDIAGVAQLLEQFGAELTDLDIPTSEIEGLLADGRDLIEQYSLAARTRDQYEQLFRPFARWCRSVSADPLPATPALVTTYLLRLARTGTTTLIELDTVGEDAEGNLRPSTLAAVVSAIGTIHRNNGHVDPTQDALVRRVLAAYRRKYGGDTTVAYGFTLADLGLMIDRCLLPDRTALRDQVLVAMGTHPEITVNASALAGLDWSHLVHLPGEDEPQLPARFDLGGRRGVLWVPPEPLDPQLCPVRLLRSWASESPATGPVFESPKKPGHPITRAGIADRLRKLVRSAGFEAATKAGEIPRLSREQRRKLLTSLRGVAPTAARDRALLSLMWWAGLRRDEASQLLVGDLEIAREGVVVRVRRSKNDQYGKGPRTAVHAQPGLIACPLDSVTSWLDAYTLLLGRPPETDAPVFPRLNQGRPTGSMSGDAINTRVQHWAGIAGIVAGDGQRVSSHGLRAGSTTALLHAGHQAEVVAAHQRRSDARHVATYYRPTSMWGDYNPTNGLGGQLREDRASSESQPTPQGGRARIADG